MTETKTYQRGSAATEICNVLRREILTLTLEPGTPLDETGLSKRFNVSRSPIREVLNRLLAERLVEALPNRTTIVAPVDLMNFSNFIEALDLQQRYATRLAARNRSADDLNNLRKLSDQYRDAVHSAKAFETLQANFEFHNAVALAGKNPYVVRQYGELLSEARRLLHIHINFLDAQGRWDVLDDQHDDFVDAIEAQDVALADRIAHEHTVQFHDRFLKALQYRSDNDFQFETTDFLGAGGRS